MLSVKASPLKQSTCQGMFELTQIQAPNVYISSTPGLQGSPQLDRNGPPSIFMLIYMPIFLGGRYLSTTLYFNFRYPNSPYLQIHCARLDFENGMGWSSVAITGVGRHSNGPGAWRGGP